MSKKMDNFDQIQLDGIDLKDLSLEGLEVTALGDAMNVPEMGASSGVSSCTSCSCCASTSCCSVEIAAQADADSAQVAELDAAALLAE